MLVALLTDGIYPYTMGGIQMHSFQMARALAHNHVKVTLYLPVIPECSRLDCFSQEEEMYITTVFVQPSASFSFPGHYIYESWKYAVNLARRFDQQPSPDFIYAQGFTGWNLLVRKKQGAVMPPVGVNFHGLNMFQPAFGIRNLLNNILFKPFVKANLKAADIVFSLGGKLTDLLVREGIRREKIIEAPVGVDNDWLVPSPVPSSGTVKFAFVGRYDKIKGFDLMNEAIQRNKNAGIQFDFHFVGPIPDSLKLRLNGVYYHGEVKDASMLRSLLRQWDVLVCASYSEGMPTVILEAMASGLAIISTNVGAVRAVVSEQNGLIIPPGDRQELEKAMLKLCELPKNQLDIMKKVSVETIQKSFLWENIGIQTIQKIKKVIGSVTF